MEGAESSQTKTKTPTTPQTAPQTAQQTAPQTAPVLREHEPLTELLSQIPHKVQRGLKTGYEALDLTCIDANQQFIALGSHIGTVFLYDRDKHTIQRLRSDDPAACARCVALHHGLDDQVAVGYTSGAIYIFQLPSMLMGHSKKLERFVVADLHQTSLTTLAWSTNGMKLYSGDSQGCVGCTEVDFIEGKCKSSPLLIESNTEIVQLDQGHRSLLVSTKHRCIVCRMDDKDRITQIGSKERKISGDFGAYFIPAMCKPEDAQLFASRPGFRVWRASIAGTVINTLIYKELVTQPHPHIPLLDFTVTNIEAGQKTNQFGPVRLYLGNKLVTWNESSLFVLEVDRTALVGSQSHIGRIKKVVISEDEIFVLRADTDRNVLRIAPKPLKTSSYKLLRQLQEERREAEIKAKEQEKEEANKETDTNSDKVTEKSPFKALQGNILDKVKIIAKPAVLKDKIQEKLNINTKKDGAPSRYSQEYVFEGEGKDQQTAKREISPPGKLPPVVRLDSPDLLTVELSSELSSDFNLKKIPSSERFSALGGGSALLDSEICTDENQSTAPQTGTGAASALARLQADQKLEDSSEPAFRVSQKEDEPVPDTSKEPEGEDSIVFARKVKPKKKKKAKERKSRFSDISGEKDQDSVSVHSSASVTSINSADSNNSETSSPARELTQTEEADPATSGPSPDTQNTQQEPDSSSFHVEAGNKELDSDSVDKVNVDAGTTKVLVNTDKDDKVAAEVGRIDEDKGVTMLDKESVNTNTTAMDTGNAAVDNVNAAHASNIEETAKQNAQSIEKSELSQKIEAAVITGKSELSQKIEPAVIIGKSELSQKIEPAVVTGKSELSQTIEPAVTTGSPYDQYLQPTDPTATNLDLEMARLDSFLGESTETSASECEKASPIASFKAGNGGDPLSLNFGIPFADGSREYQTQNSTSSSSKSVRRLESQLEQLDQAAMSSLDQPDQSYQDLPQSISSLSSLPYIDKMPSEDFYSKYSSKSPGEMSPSYDNTFSDDNIPEIAKSESRASAMDDELNELQVSDRSHFLKTVNNWTEVATSGNIHSISVSNSHVWVTDKSCNIFYSPVSSPGLNWKKASGNANQISVSACGNILWSLYRNTVSAGTKITAKRPEGMKWVEAVSRDVAYICVDQTCAWYIKTNNEVMIQKHLSRDRPCFKGERVDCAHKLQMIACRAGVVWALTDKCKWLYRSGITRGAPEGKGWKSGDSGSENRLFSHLSLGDNNFGWAIDVVGQVWFCSGVTMETPRGDGKWWQVPLSGEYLMKDPSTLDLLKSFSTKLDPHQLTQLLNTQTGGLVAATAGIWVCPEFKHVLHVCRGNIEGQLWEDAQPESLSSTAAWKTIACRNAANDKGLIWGQQPSGDLFAFTADRKTCTNIRTPSKKGSSVLFTCLAVCNDAFWGLTCDGEIHIRTGMSSLEPMGTDWCKLDLSQIEESHLVHISCSKLNVWAVDSDGLVFHRIGVKAPTDHSLNAAWLPVDNGGTVFTQIVAGSQDWKVWAIDNRRQVYVRTGITTEMPIGRKWMHVSGTQAMQLSMSISFVWALNHSGELLCRHGVAEDNVTGDYWKKQPGFLHGISAAPSNSLWGINKDGQLVRRRTRYIMREKEGATKQTGATKGREGAKRGISTCSDDLDWELV